MTLAVILLTTIGKNINDHINPNPDTLYGLKDLEYKKIISKLPIDPINTVEYFYKYEPVGDNPQFGITCDNPRCAYILSARLESFTGSPGCASDREELNLNKLNYCIPGGGARPLIP